MIKLLRMSGLLYIQSFAYMIPYMIIGSLYDTNLITVFGFMYPLQFLIYLIVYYAEAIGTISVVRDGYSHNSKEAQESRSSALTIMLIASSLIILIISIFIREYLSIFGDYGYLDIAGISLLVSFISYSTVWLLSILDDMTHNGSKYYTVLFLDTSGKPLRLYSTQTNPELWSHDLDDDPDSIPDIISKYYDHENNEDVCAFDVDEETRRHEPWTGGPSDFKENLDAFLNGDVFVYPSENGEYDYGSSAQIGTGGFIGKYSNRKFEETLGEYTYNVESEDVDENNDTLLKNKEKRVIVYRLLP